MKPSLFLIRLIPALLLLALPPVLRAQRPLGPIFEVNDQHVGVQHLPHVAMNERGDFVVTWLHTRIQDRFYSLYASRFEPDGTPATGDVLVSDRVLNSEMNASVTVLSDGSFVVVFLDEGAFKARRFDPDGTFEGESVIAENALQSFAIASRDRGFVFAWVSREGTLLVRSFSASGEPAGPARWVGQGSLPALAIGPGGESVVTWIASQPIPEEPRYAYQYLLAQRFGAKGAPRGERIVVRGRPSAFIGLPKVAKDGAGNFLVVWREPFNNFAEDRIYARRYAADGSSLGGPLVLNQGKDRLEGPDLAMGRNGNFALAWTKADFTAGGRSDVFAQRFSAEGVPLRPAFQVSRGFGGSAPGLAGDANGNFVVVWHSRDESLSGVFARRFSRR